MDSLDILNVNKFGEDDYMWSQLPERFQCQQTNSDLKSFLESLESELLNGAEYFLDRPQAQQVYQQPPRPAWPEREVCEYFSEFFDTAQECQEEPLDLFQTQGLSRSLSLDKLMTISQTTWTE